MVTVIKRGERVVTCNRCLSDMKYEESDIKKEKFSITGGKSGYKEGYREFIVCPVCGNYIQLEEKVTKHISAFAMNELVYKRGYKVESI